MLDNIFGHSEFGGNKTKKVWFKKSDILKAVMGS